MSQPTDYRGYRFPPDIIRHAVWLYFRFGLSFRDVEDRLAERGVTVTYEGIRQWSARLARAFPRMSSGVRAPCPLPRVVFRMVLLIVPRHNT